MIDADTWPAGAPALLATVWQRLQDAPAAQVYLHPAIWTAFGGILVLERWWPARREQPTWSTGFWHDVAYLVLISVFRVSVLALFVSALGALYERHLGFLTISAAAHWPFVVRAGLAVLLVDLLAWFHHYLRHKVPLLWHFHAVHHSQREMNLFTDVRYHPFEYFVTRGVQWLPLAMLGDALPTLLVYDFVHQVYTKLYHANVRGNLGSLRFILVTPQSHRIHHSVDPLHRDRNYGVIFSVWDWLFRTQYLGHTEYPDTGVDLPEFPVESRPGVRALLAAHAAQFAYPFRTALAGLPGRRSVRRTAPSGAATWRTGLSRDEH